MKQSETVGNSRGRLFSRQIFYASIPTYGQIVWKSGKTCKIEKRNKSQRESVGNSWKQLGVDFLAAEFPLFLHFVGYKSADKTHKSHNFCRQKIHTQLFPTDSRWLLFLFLILQVLPDFQTICPFFCTLMQFRLFAERTVCPDCFRLFPTVSCWIIFLFCVCCEFRHCLFLFVELCFCWTIWQFDLLISTLFQTVLLWPQRSGLAIFQMDFWSYLGLNALFLYYSKHAALGTTQQSSNYAWTLNS